MVEETQESNQWTDSGIYGTFDAIVDVFAQLIKIAPASHHSFTCSSFKDQIHDYKITSWTGCHPSSSNAGENGLTVQHLYIREHLKNYGSVARVPANWQKDPDVSSPMDSSPIPVQIVNYLD